MSDMWPGCALEKLWNLDENQEGLKLRENPTMCLFCTTIMKEKRMLLTDDIFVTKRYHYIISFQNNLLYLANSLQ